MTIYDMNTRVYFYIEKIFHRLESDSARNNIHSNNKQKPEITNKITGKGTCHMASSQAKCETCFQANVLIFTLIFRCSG